MLDNKLLDRAERESVIVLNKLFVENSLMERNGNILSLLSAMFVRGWMAAVIYMEEKREE